MKIDPVLAAKYRPFYFMMRFDKQRIVAVPHEEQLRRSIEFLRQLGKIHPLMKRWLLQGNSLKSALKYDVTENPDFLAKRIEKDADPTEPTSLSYSFWNGEADSLSGLTFSYSAHDHHHLSFMNFEGIGSLILSTPDEVRTTAVAIIGTVVRIWPEIDWASLAPQDYFLYEKSFKDRQTIGWIGFCPHALRHEDFPEAYELKPVAERGTIIVNTEAIMDERNPGHVAIVDKADMTLSKMGLLPLYNN